MLLLLTALLPACNRSEPCEAVGTAVVQPATPPRNLLVISIDTLRRDRVGYNAGDDAVSPVLDSLLSGGVTLQDHRSCSNWTFASMMCALGGRYNLELGFIADANNMQLNPIPEETWMLGSWLISKGFSTGLVSSNFWLGTDYGFDRFYQTLLTNPSARADMIVDAALATVDKVTEGAERWYFHVHFIDPHLPYRPPEQYLAGLEGLEETDFALSTEDGVRGFGDVRDQLSEEEQALVLEHIRVRYDGEINLVDDELGRLLAGLEAKGLLEDTLVVVFSDHGEQFWEHGNVGHAQSIYGEETKAIAAFVGPGISPAEWSGPTTHADIFPTITTALGLDAPEELIGLPAGMASDAECPRYAAHMSAETTRQSVELDGMRLIYTWDGTLELYDLKADPGEQVDLFNPEDPRVEPLWDLLRRRVKAVRDLYDKADPVTPDL